jgi:cutinase
MEGGKKPGGGNAVGDTCIKGWYKKLGMPPPQGLKRFGDYSQMKAYEDLMSATVPVETAEAIQQRDIEAETDTAADACTPYIMLYARGTTEAGELGSTVGPALKSGLASDKNWSVRGITTRDGYDASLTGIYCIGMDGGMGCKTILEKMVAQCPNSKFVTAGYSQGAMVARICVAYASEAAKAKVAGVCLLLLLQFDEE